MKKPFRDARIEPNDDGTFTVCVYVEKPREKKSGGNETMSMYPDYEERRYSAQSLSDAVEKIENMAGKSSGDADVSDFMNPSRMAEESPEQD